VKGGGSVEPASRLTSPQQEDQMMRRADEVFGMLPNLRRQ
jgi:hypothetical protein